LFLAGKHIFSCSCATVMGTRLDWTENGVDSDGGETESTIYPVRFNWS
jgi:hypothetical protein